MKSDKNILLISPQPDLSIIGLKHLHYYLLKNGFQSHLLHIPRFDPTVLHAFRSLGELVSRLDPLFIGISLMSTDYDCAREVSVYFKNNFPSIPIVWGGIHPTIAPESCFPFADYVCIGEGEKTALDLAHALVSGQDPRPIPNLCYEEEGRLKRNPLYPLIEDLDTLPFCDHIPTNSFLQEKEGDIHEIDLKTLDRYARYHGRIYDVKTSLGCHLTCTYCCTPFLSRLYGTRKVRKRSVESIIRELERAIRDYPFIEMINFQDENFLCYGPEFMKNFCEEYQQRINKPFMSFCTPMYVNREKIAMLKKAGMTWARMGLQSGSDRVCTEVYKRKSLPKHYLKAAQIFSEFGIAVYCDVILDNPLESDEDKLETVKVLVQAPKPFYLQPYSLTPYHGTELYERIVKECPETLPDSREKDQLIYQKNIYNVLVRLAPHLPRKLMGWVVRLCEENPEGIRFKAALLAAKVVGLLFFEPLSYFRAAKLSQGGSYRKLFRVVPVYLKMALSRYSKHYLSE